MTKEEIRLQVALSCIQGVLEAKHGIIGEIVPEVAVKESLRIADAFVEEWYRGQKEPHYTKRNALFDKCVENCDPVVMKNVSDGVDEMLQKEQKLAECSEGERIRKELIAVIDDLVLPYDQKARFIAWLEKHSEEEIQKIRKEEYTNGFNDAAGFGKQKDLALTWEDIPTLIRLCEQVKTEWWFRDMKGIGTQKFFEEILRRFLEQTKK